MAHFAELDASNTVLRALVVHNDVTLIDGVEVEQRGIDFLNDLFPDSGDWKQCSYNHKMRGHFPSIGDTYDSDLDLFVVPQLFPSWTLNETTGYYEPPTPQPAANYYWDEDITSWVEVE